MYKCKWKYEKKMPIIFKKIEVQMYKCKWKYEKKMPIIILLGKLRRKL